MLVELGGGRKTTKDKLDSTCGFHIYKKLNQKIDLNEPIVEIFGSNQQKIENAKKMFDNVIFIKNTKHEKECLTIYE